MNESISDGLRRLAAELLESPRERQRFVEAGRVLLYLDPAIKRLPAGKRAKLISKPISTIGDADAIVDALNIAVQRVVTEYPDATKLVADPMLLRRILAACVVVKGLPPNQDRRLLSEATHLLRDIWDDAEKAALQDHGRKRHEQSPTKESPEARKFAENVQHEAAKLRSKYRRSTQAFRLRQLVSCFPGKWPNQNALRGWMNRHALRI